MYKYIFNFVYQAEVLFVLESTPATDCLFNSMIYLKNSTYLGRKNAECHVRCFVINDDTNVTHQHSWTIYIFYLFYDYKNVITTNSRVNERR